METSKKVLRAIGRALWAGLRFPFRAVRLFLVVFVMALARALGGEIRIEKPAPRNQPTQVSEKR